ncbi:Transmembrane protein 62 [Dermatophagoides pteronyssinus]|uniref:Transmembrane protein 62 n=1 Tax=Dermatophagoides pteronyssinus TaxID=6956 RepID=A0ABQ8JWU6_DERPT|nr:Transmembrane protein 62 [Dermatophagoides pteronyssinus]
MILNCLMILLILIIVVLFSLAVLFILILPSHYNIVPDNRISEFFYQLNLFDNLDLNFKQKMVTKVTLILLLALIFVAIFVSSFLHIINTEDDYNNHFRINQTQILNDPIQIDDKYENLFWFIHISDTHLSYYRDQSRKTDLVDFCRSVIPIIKPSVLVLSGDITDARTKLPLGSEQYRDEWIMYQDVHEQCLKANPDLKWLDIKGNHDTFNSYKNHNNFDNFTVQSNMSSDGRSYLYQYQATDGNRYSFIGADACLKPGVRRPFNFLGQFDENELDKLRKFKQDSLNTTYTIWYGHYPTAAIFNRDSFREIINGPYLCGHYHTIHGLVPNMITTQQQGYLEAETGDWKDYRIFRIVAIDHGLFTFANYYYRPHQQQPLIVITNPRSILHQMEHLEPFWRTANSTHIRTLIFSHRPIINVKAYITKQQKFNPNEFVEKFELKHVHGYLWVSPWSPKKYASGLYFITVITSDDHYSNQLTVPFSLDRSKSEFSFLARLLLRFDFRTITMFLYSWSFLIATLPLIFLRIFTSNEDNYIKYMCNLSRRRYIRKVVFRLFLLSHQDKLFYPIIILPLYSLIGPWFLAYLVSDYVGIVFAWGQFIDGYFLPVGFTFVFSAIFIMIFHLPFMVSLSIIVYLRYVEIETNDQNGNEHTDESPRTRKRNLNRIFKKMYFYALICVILTASQFCAALIFYWAYGFLAFITNFYVWSCPVYLMLIRFALNLDGHDFKPMQNKTTYQSCSTRDNIDEQN